MFEMVGIFVIGLAVLGALIKGLRFREWEEFGDWIVILLVIASVFLVPLFFIWLYSLLVK